MQDHDIHKIGKDSTEFKEHLHEHFFFFNSDNDELDESDKPCEWWKNGECDCKGRI